MRRFSEIDRRSVLVSNDLGEYALLTPTEADDLQHGRWHSSSSRRMDLEARSLLSVEPPQSDLELAALRTRKSFLVAGPALHIFVVTLRCDHSCHYCQVSRANLAAPGFDMSEAHADAALDIVFQSPSPTLTIEFQGGEPALRFDLIRHIVAGALERNRAAQRTLRFTMVSTLHHLAPSELEFCREHEIHLSTSIDGHEALHNAQRPNPTRDSWRRTIDALGRARDALGREGVAALPTITRSALQEPEQLIDQYLALGFRSIFLRPLSPYGFARRTSKVHGYSTDEFMRFYERGLDHMLALNSRGEEVTEVYASILLRHIWTPFHSGYVDLRSPAGAGLGTLVYNYDGDVYPSDEARMAAAAGDGRFRLGPVVSSLDELLASPAMQWLRTGAVAEELPKCRDCAFVPFCGADPVHHATVHGDPIGDRDNSDFCDRQTAMFRLLFKRIAERDSDTMRTFTAWALQRSRGEIKPLGFVEQ